MIKILFTGMTKTRSLDDLGTKIPKNPGLRVNYVIANMGGGGFLPLEGSRTFFCVRLHSKMEDESFFGVQDTFQIIGKALVKQCFGASGERCSKYMKNIMEFQYF